jgi:septal ring factor EnvC (AmiA/AmiB activator)
MDKLNLTNLHPNLIMGMSEFEISDFIAKLLQSLRDLEEQQEVEGSYKQLKTEQKKLKKEQEQLKLDQDLLKLGQEQLKTNQEQLMKYQVFILKLSRQNEEIKANIQKLQDPKPKRRSGSNHS